MTAGGRVFFSSTGRSLVEEDVVELRSVGVDIGSSTSHLVFSRITLERLDSRYVIAGREVTHESKILLTPYLDPVTIDAEALGAFIEESFHAARMSPDDIDTGALILTGVAVRRRNARAVGELFAGQAGKFVAVSAGDALEAVMSAHGSGAAALSVREQATIMNVDIGGGTSKIAIARAGEVVDSTAIDVGARLIVLDEDGRLVRIEEAGRLFIEACGIRADLGDALSSDDRQRLAGHMAEHLFAAMRGGDLPAKSERLMRLPPLRAGHAIDIVTFSGGVSQFVYGESSDSFGDLGPELAAAVRERLAGLGPRLARGAETIRATVIGASQYTVQVSGSTIYLSSNDVVPVRNVAAVAPTLDLAGEEIDETGVAEAVGAALSRLDLADGEQPVALCLRWEGSATFQRLDALSRGLVAGLAPVLANGHPLTLVADSDIGGLLGIHCREELKLASPIISIDGIALKEFDFVDIGALLVQTGAVPVVIKSLVFPSEVAAARQGSGEEKARAMASGAAR
ncbi:MAG TPA: ethanolamine ammonia-lyase reactivating factor EutA [Afifellaceae bacterium]|nr:ethanolamine ammonia-lyase reactivating factor EutA [Afifellaceae bacterium]